MALIITMKETHQVKKPGTKTVWQIVSTQEETINQETVKNYTESCSFFRRLGGIETLTKSYTCAGYVPVKLVSTNPDRDVRKIRQFTYNYE